jgi:hypothetical protein
LRKATDFKSVVSTDFTTRANAIHHCNKECWDGDALQQTRM